MLFNNPSEVLYKFAKLSLKEFDKLKAIGYFDAPASKGHHLAEKGGLCRHSLNVTNRLISLSDEMMIDWSREESPWIVGMLHDLVKCKCYKLNPDGKTYSYIQSDWPGHGVASVMIATVELGIQLNPDEAAAIIHHMGAFGLQGQAMQEFDAALIKYPGQIISTHAADWLASRLDEVGNNKYLEA